MKTDKDGWWVLIRGDEVRNVFKNRQEAVKHLKKMITQTLKDLDKQDRTNGFDYSIIFQELKIVPVEEREAYLGL